MARRLFNSRERTALFLAADGRSEMSGEPLGSDFHADHIYPFCAGGETDVINGQVLTPKENLAKSSGNLVLRNWQKIFLAKWQASGVDFLLAALPGCGKTIAALSAAKRFLDRYPAGRILIVCPSRNLQEQWRDEAGRDPFRIHITTKEFVGHWKSGFSGLAITYQTVANNHLVFRRLTSNLANPTLVIFDEIHHAGDDLSWGDAIRSAFENAKQRLLLSGTPFRTDGAPIPFVRYDDDGQSIANARYDYPDAIKDGVLRVVAFHHHDGDVKYLDNAGNVVVGLVNSQVAEDDAKAHLGMLISGDGQFARSLLEKANKQLCLHRRKMPNAGGLVLCRDTYHAQEIARVLTDVTGVAPDVVVSDDEIANSNVKSFRDSDRPWIVAVRQVSEGVDIRRLMVLCYLTNTVTELFFRQAIGRIVRNMKTKFDQQADCFIPDDPRLTAMALAIDQFQVQAKREIKEETDDQDQEREIGERSASTRTLLETSEANPVGVTIDGRAFDLTEIAEIRDAAEETGISEIQAARLFERWNARACKAASNGPYEMPIKTQPREMSLEETSDYLRREINKKCNQFAAQNGVEPQAVHTRYFRIDNTKQADMNVSQLKRKLQWINSQR